MDVELTMVVVDVVHMGIVLRKPLSCRSPENVMRATRPTGWRGGAWLSRPLPALLMILALALAACGTTDEAADTGTSASPETAASGGLAVVATTTILGDVATEVVGDQGDVATLMPAGADPHSFEPSAQQVEQMQEADLIVANGANLEDNLTDAIAEAEAAGVAVFTAVDHVDTLTFEGGGAHGHGHEGEEGAEEHSDEEHAHGDEQHSEDAHSNESSHSDGEHSDEEHAHGDEQHSEDAHSNESSHSDGEHSDEGHTHAEGAVDPHFWMDPTRTAAVVSALGEELAGMADDGDATRQQAEEYAGELTDLAGQIEEALSAVPDDARTLVTNHEAFSYFADRFGFEIAGTVIPDVSTGAEPSAEDLAQLAETIREQDVAAIFAETTQPERLAETVAGEVGQEVEVVELYTGSLGEEGSEADSYTGMMEVNAQRIADALSG
jgi:zinc/manganese transport system substrate-binding protein